MDEPEVTVEVVLLTAAATKWFRAIPKPKPPKPDTVLINTVGPSFETLKALIESEAGEPIPEEDEH